MFALELILYLLCNNFQLLIFSSQIRYRLFFYSYRCKLPVFPALPSPSASSDFWPTSSHTATANSAGRVMPSALKHWGNESDMHVPLAQMAMGGFLIRIHFCIPNLEPVCVLYKVGDKSPSSGLFHEECTHSDQHLSIYHSSNLFSSHSAWVIYYLLLSRHCARQ